MPLRLPDVTLCCVDTTDRLPWAVRALERCVADIVFGDAFLATDAAALAGLRLPPGVRGEVIEPLRSIDAYSRFMIERLAPFVRTPYVLIVQWDGFVLDASRWTDEFLQVDYLGAPWHYHEAPYRVGNGGFSLRSRRLLQALPALPADFQEPEDRFICRTWRPEAERQGLRFASPELAARFSTDFGDLDHRPFGFHGPVHFPEVLGVDATAEYLASLDPSRQLATRASRDVMLGLMADLERLRPRRPELQALRPRLSAHLQRAIAAVDPAAIGPAELERLARGLVRHGYRQAATALLAVAAPVLDGGTRRSLQARLVLRRLQRRLRGAPLDG